MTLAAGGLGSLLLTPQAKHIYLQTDPKTASRGKRGHVIPPTRLSFVLGDPFTSISAPY